MCHIKLRFTIFLHHNETHIIIQKVTHRFEFKNYLIGKLKKSVEFYLVDFSIYFHKTTNFNFVLNKFRLMRYNIYSFFFFKLFINLASEGCNRKNLYLGYCDAKHQTLQHKLKVFEFVKIKIIIIKNKKAFVDNTYVKYTQSIFIFILNSW